MYANQFLPIPIPLSNVTNIGAEFFWFLGKGPGAIASIVESRGKAPGRG